MPTRKQRRRREKEQRHEWEYVVYDDEGREVEIDPANMRKEKERRDGSKAAASKNGKPAAQPRDRKGRPLRPQKPPTWRRAATRAGIFAVALLVFTSFLNQKDTQWGTRIAITLAYGLLAIPFFYFMDRATYRRYLKLAGREDELKPRR